MEVEHKIAKELLALMEKSQVSLYAEGSPYTTYEHLVFMCHEIMDMHDSLKANRWIGYVQGVLVTLGVTTVDKQRELVRKHL